MSYTIDCILVAENHFGHHQPEIMAEWLLSVGADHYALGERELDMICRNIDEYDTEQRYEVQGYIDDLFNNAFEIEGQRFYFWSHPDWMDVWAIPDGADPEDYFGSLDDEDEDD